MYPERSSGALSPDDDNDCDFRDAAAEAELEAEVAAGEAQGSISSSSQQPEEAAEESSEGPGGGAAAGGDTVAVNAGGGSSGPHQPKKRYVGVRQRPSGRWVAEIKDTTHKIRLWLGTFNNPEDAARAYDDAARTLRGANTRTNFTRPLGTRPGFSSNSVRLLLQKAVEAAAVAGNLDSGGVLPSVAAAAGGGAGGGGASSSSSAAAVPSSFAATSNAPQDPGPSNFMGGFHSDSELEEALRQRQRADSSGASNLFGQLNPRHGISRSVSYDQATMMRSQAAGPGPGSNPNLRLYTSFSGDFSGSHAQAAAPSGSFDLQQMQQMPNARQSGTTFGAPGYEAQPPDQTDRRATQQGSSSSRYHAQFNIYESLREKLGYGPPTPTSTGGHGTGDAGFAFSRDGTSAFAATTTGAEAVDNMDLGWDPNPSVESGGSLIQHWGRSAGTDMLISRVHEQQPTIPDHVQQQQQQQASRRMNESWEHGNVGSRGHEAAAAADHERFGLEEIATVNWGNLGTSSTGDAAAHDTMSPLNWEDLGRTLATSSSEQQRPVERLTTINWGDLISRTTASGEAQRMEGVTSWGPGNMGGFTAPNSWTSGPAAGHGSGHHHFPATPLPTSSSHEYWEAAAAAQAQVPTGMGHLQESHDRLQMQSSSSRPGLWATSSSQPQYAQDATFPQQRVISREASLSARRPADQERLPNIQQQQQQQQHGSQVEAATRQPTGSEQDSESAEEDLDLPRGSQQQGDSNSSETQGRFMDYSSMDPTNRDTMASSLSGLLSHNQADQADSGLNFLMLSPGFFRMGSFQRREPSTPANIAALADHETDDATEQDADLISADDLPAASNSVRPLTAGSPLSEVQTTVDLDPSLAGLVRPKLVRINAACLPEVGVDDADDRSPTRSQMLGEAVRSHLILGGSVITTQDLVAATRSASDPDVTHASDAPFQQALPDQR